MSNLRMRPWTVRLAAAAFFASTALVSCGDDDSMGPLFPSGGDGGGGAGGSDGGTNPNEGTAGQDSGGGQGGAVDQSGGGTAGEAGTIQAGSGNTGGTTSHVGVSGANAGTSGTAESKGGTTSGGTAGSGATDGGAHAGNGGGAAGDASGNGGAGAGGEGAMTAGAAGIAGAGGIGGSLPIGCPSELCSKPFSAENCGPNCEPVTSTACLECEATLSCAIDFECFEVAGDASAGPAEGTARSALCLETLSCLRKSNCWDQSDDTGMACYCGAADEDQCRAGNGNGPCRNELERGMESTDYDDILDGLANLELGGGYAVTVADCDQQCDPGVCFATDD